MIASEFVQHRLHNQRISHSKFELPGQAVSWFGAMQAQDYASVKWAVGQRCYGATDATIEAAIANKTIVRTWLMRGTLHVAAASDVGWMLACLAPRLIANSARRYRQLDLDEAAFVNSYKILTKALDGSRQLTRPEIKRLLEQGGLPTTGQRVYHILRRAGLEGLICYGPTQENHETFVLLDEWSPSRKMVDRTEALAELTERYFRSHGPGTLQDFVWWSGLKVADARIGLEGIKNHLQAETMDGETYWVIKEDSIREDSSPTAYLLPAYDEYFLGYKDRKTILDPKYDSRAVSSSGVFRPMLVIDGQIVGAWKRDLKKGSVIITPNLFRSLTPAENQFLLASANQYSAFLGLPIELNLNPNYEAKF